MRPTDPGSGPSRATTPLPILLASLAILGGSALLAQTLSGEPRGKPSATAAVDSLWRAGQRDSAAALTAILVRQARATGDSVALMDLQLRAGRQARLLGPAAEAEGGLREALAMATARADTARRLAALRWLSVVTELRGRGDEARDLSESLRVEAAAAGDARHAAWGHIGLAWHALQGGRTADAEEQYESAAALFAGGGDLEGELWSLLGLGLTRTRAGRLRAAIAAYQRAADLAASHGERLTEAIALNDLAAIDFYLGDPVRAIAQFERSRAIHRELGSWRETIRPTLNIALCLGELGLFPAAEESLQAGLELCRDRGYSDLEPLVLTHQARLSARRGRTNEAARRFREILTADEKGSMGPLSMRSRLQCLEGAAEALTALGSAAAALELLGEAHELLRERDDGEMAARIGVRLAQAMLALGRHEDGLREARRAAQWAGRRGQNQETIDALIEAASAWRALAVPDSARATLVRAAEIWDSDRARSLDPTWRERRGMTGPRIYTSLAALMLAEADSAARRAAFDRLQAFKSRTLLERLLDPGGERSRPGQNPPAPLADLATLQRSILRPGELLLDFYLGPDTSLAWAVTRDTAAVVGLPPGGRLDPMLLYYHQLVSQPPARRAERASLEPIQRTGALLARTLLGELDALIERSETIIVAPDGRLGLISPGELARHLRPGSPAGQARRAGGSRRWVQVPSATILAQTRTASRAVESRPARILAVAGSHSSRGQLLRGSAREVRQLERRFRHARVVMAPRDGSALVARLHAAEVLHFASHLAIDEQSPWQSELCFSPAGSPGNLRAAEISALRLPARLAILSNCSSASGQVLSGEGILGVASAFLSAGVPAVLAARWPVDDDATADFMLQIYDLLAAGETVAAAVARAQDIVASRADTEHPFFWAAFVVLGDGDVRLELASRPGWIRLLAAGLAAMALLLAMGIAARRGRSDRPPPGASPRTPA